MSAIIKWKIVPEEPTLDMIGMAGIARMQCWRNGEGAIVRPIWEAMLAAAPQPDMTPTKKIDAALDSVLAACGSDLKTVHENTRHYKPSTKDDMRAAMRKIMAESYIEGCKAANRIIDEREITMDKIDLDDVQACADVLQDMCHGAAKESGWWTDIKTGLPILTDRPHLVGEKLMLIVSEVAEAMEGHRKNLNDDKLPHRKMVEVELADAVIRIFDLAGAMGLDMGGAIAQKMAYNATREDHKIENRRAEGGKAY